MKRAGDYHVLYIKFLRVWSIAIGIESMMWFFQNSELFMTETSILKVYSPFLHIIVSTGHDSRYHYRHNWLLLLLQPPSNWSYN